jgi:hypothetical protein
MAEQIEHDKSAGLERLYARITKISEDMDGIATRTAQSLGLPTAMVPTPSRDDVPVLLVRMPDTFQVDFAPSHPLSAPGGALSVKAKRLYGGLRKSDWAFTFVHGEWRAHNPVSDDTIRACLTPGGPKPAIY